MGFGRMVAIVTSQFHSPTIFIERLTPAWRGVWTCKPPSPTTGWSQSCRGGKAYILETGVYAPDLRGKRSEWASQMKWVLMDGKDEERSEGEGVHPRGQKASSLESISLPVLASQWILPPPQEIP